MNDEFPHERVERPEAPRFSVCWGIIIQEGPDGDKESWCDGELQTEAWDEALKCIIQHGRA